ncbi:Galactinol synthase 1 [Ananas comosus]|uniref:Hexosyltransferase n=1 Tax=Ananas comosus TaxID=4615 RepID=A0A199V972_ANACO|nr:Galactinol synthase 1 [Ananas comosus]
MDTKIVKKLSPNSKSNVYVTFLAGDGDYVKGVVGLAKGLRKVGSAYPLVVVVLDDVPESHRRLLESQGCIVREIEPVHPPENQTQFAMAYYVINYSKLRIWKYERMIYLDADIQVYENIDHLFDLPHGYFYAVKDCFCEKTWSHTPQYKIGYCQQCPERVSWPADELGPPPPLYFNAGMFVSEPDTAIADSLLAALKVAPTTPFAEQNVELDKVKVVHYCAAPWRFTGKEPNMDREDIKMLVSKWWDIYNDDSLDYKGDANGVKPPLKAALSKAGVALGCLIWRRIIESTDGYLGSLLS